MPIFHNAYASVIFSTALLATITVVNAGSNFGEPLFQGDDHAQLAVIPQGKIFQFTLDHSAIYPGTERTITVYVPSEYTADKPACVYFGLDRLGFEATAAFDQLIFNREMPITIAIGIEPGTVASSKAPQNPRFNRSYEFDSLNDNLARFVLDEVLPEVEQHKTPAGRPIRLSNDPNDRAVGGASTGGIGAFTLAWQHPDAFRRVFTAIGTFVGMRGGDQYPVLVRKTEPKPIRIFMVDGSNDEWMGGPELGDWWMSNQTMERALEFAGYEVNHAWSNETHDTRHATAVFPDAMRWLWKDWPRPITAGQSRNLFLNAILKSDQSWQIVPGIYASNGNLTADQSGAIVFRDSKSGKRYRLEGDESFSKSTEPEEESSAIAFDADGRRYACNKGRIFMYDHHGQRIQIATGIHAQQLLVTHDRRLYATEAGDGDTGGKVWFVDPGGHKRLIDSGLNHPSAIALSPDGLWLAVAENKTHWGFSYRVSPDGSAQDKQRFYWFHVPDTAGDSGVASWVMDRDGRLYAATRMGVQVFDRNGRVRAILPLPGGPVTGLAFGGKDFGTLYVSCANHRLYRRKLKVNGAPGWMPPIVLPPWGPG